MSAATGSTPQDADRMARKFTTTLKRAGQRITRATFVYVTPTGRVAQRDLERDDKHQSDL